MDGVGQHHPTDAEEATTHPPEGTPPSPLRPRPVPWRPTMDVHPDAASEPGPAEPRSRARRNFVPLVAGQAISLFGDYVAWFTLPYFVLSLTGRPLDLGLTAFAETLPMLLFGFTAGAYLDRRRRLLPVLVSADLARAGVFGLLGVVAATGAATPTLVFAAAFVAGSLAVLFDAGFHALMPGLLEEDMLVEAHTKLGFARSSMFALGPLVAGFAIAKTNGFVLAFLLDAATFVASAGFLLSTRRLRPRVRSESAPILRSIAEGLRFLFREPRLRLATLGGLVTNFVFSPLSALLILFVASQILDTEQTGLSLTGDGLRIGLYVSGHALVGALGVAFASRVAAKIGLGRLFVVGLTMFGSGFLLVALWHSYWSFLGAGVGVAGVMWVNVAFSTMRQRLSPEPLLARVVSASRTITWAGLPAGAALGSGIAEAVGLVPVYVFGSAVVIVTGLVLSRTALGRLDLA
ncbi:MAG TPA: hypothetical protein ENK55_03725 [Actinobacteria bacterium]|nr:hypothetical protein [Actinomycetota bacterium]